MSTSIGEAFVTIGANLNPLKAGFASIKGLAKGAGAAFGGLALGVGAAAAGMGAALAAAIPLVSMGSDMDEMQSKFATVFGEEADSATKFADHLSQKVGRSFLDIQKNLGEFQDLFAGGMGFSRKDARLLSQSVVELGTDLASFGNMSDGEALEALNSGLTGSHETLKKFGVFINDNNLSLKLHEMGLAKNAQVATENQKALARMALVLEQTKDAQGDAAKTSGGLANSWKRLTGNLFDMASKIGQSLVPAAGAVVAAFSQISGWANENIGLFTGIGAGITTMIQAAVAGFQPVLSWLLQLTATIIEFGFRGSESFGMIWDMIGSILPSFSTVKEWIDTLVFTFLNWDLTVKTLGVTMAEMVTNLIGRFQNFATNIGAIIEWFQKDWQAAFLQVAEIGLGVMENLGTNIRAIFAEVFAVIRSGFTKAFEMPPMKGIVEGIRQTTEGPKFKVFEAADFSDQFDEISKEWVKRRDEWESLSADNAITLGGEKKQFEKTDFKSILDGLISGGAGEGKGKKSGKDVSFSGLGDAFKKNNERMSEMNKERAIKDVAKKAESQRAEQARIAKEQLNTMGKMLDRLVPGGLT